MAQAQYTGTGRRKNAVARVRLVPGTGKITVNKKDVEEYIPHADLRLVIKNALDFLLVMHVWLNVRNQVLRKLVKLASSLNVKKQLQYSIYQHFMVHTVGCFLMFF